MKFRQHPSSFFGSLRLQSAISWLREQNGTSALRSNGKGITNHLWPMSNVILGFCVGYHKLCSVARLHAYPRLPVKEKIDSIQVAPYFHVLFASSRWSWGLLSAEICEDTTSTSSPRLFQIGHILSWLRTLLHHSNIRYPSCFLIPDVRWHLSTLLTWLCLLVHQRSHRAC